MDFSDCDSIDREVLLLLHSDIAVDIAELELILCLGLLHHNKKKKKQKKLRAYWTKPWLLRRTSFGHYENLMKELALEDPCSFRNFVRMDQTMFNELLQRVGPRIEKKDTFFRKAIEPGLRLSITLRYLATGDSYKSLQYSFRVAHNTISKIVPETCEAIVEEYLEEVLSCPRTPEQWKEVASLFAKRWNFNQTVGALDGKHIAIRCPPGGSSIYYNYKGFHSIVLLALVDADYKFLYVDVGTPGASSDAGIFSATALRSALEDNLVGLPQPEPLPNDNTPIPYFLVGDDAFPLRPWLMKPYPQRNLSNQNRIFNYRLSRARRVVENAFGIMASRYGDNF